MRRALPAACLLAALLAPTAARAADVPAGAKWSEATIAVPDGTKLHADVLRPKDLPDTARTPVIVSIGPYFNHSGQTGPAGPVEGTDYDPIGPPSGPSERFHDFIEGGRLMERGYTFVMVDLRGFGGSSGCLDWVGPGEQADVRAAVEWAASQPWSTGRVGMYGKSYDGVTGLVGVMSKPKGLAAVVSQEPVYDMYRYLYSNGVRFANSVGTPALYGAIAATPGPLLDNPLYNLGGLTDPACLALNWAQQQSSDHGSAYWKARDLIAKAKGADVPLFLTQGFLENNTKPDGTWDLFNAVSGFKRGWFGMWDHVRGNDTDSSGRLAMGRKGWFDEVMRFFDHFVRDVPLADAAVDKDPPMAVQTSDGTWRSEQAWPPADSRMLETTLRPGSYVDDGNNSGTGSGSGNGIWTISPPLAHDAWYAGVPRATLELSAPLPRANVVVDVYDIAPDRQAILLSRNASLVPPDGKVTLDLYGNDWKVPAGHRVGVLVSGSNAEWWLHLPTMMSVKLASGTIALPFLRHARPDTIEGGRAIRLDAWLKSAPFEVAQEDLDAGTSDGFALPEALVAAPRPQTGRPPQSRPNPPRKRLRVRIAGESRRIAVYGNAPRGARLVVRLQRLVRGRAQTVRTVKRTTRINAFRVVVGVKRAGTYRATVRAVKGKTTWRATSARVRVR